MGIFEMVETFPDKLSCIRFLESIGWRHGAYCPHCSSVHVSRKNKYDELGQWNCLDCRSSFNVISKTLFSRTKIPLQKWFLAIVIMMNAKKGISSPQLARDLSLDQKSAWYLMIRIRREMASKENHLLEGIVEIDETYVGGKSRGIRGRGTKKAPVIGAAQRGRKIVAKMMRNVSGYEIEQFVKEFIKSGEARLMTDEFKGTNPSIIYFHEAL